MRVVRRATPDDAEALALVHVESWKVAYEEVFPREALSALDASQRIPVWERNLSDRRLITLVVEVEGGVVGFALLGPERHLPGVEGTPEPDVGEVYAVYLHPSVWRQGLGRRLMNAAEAELAAAGYREAVLWVLDANHRARAFYRATGWSPDGAVASEPIFGVESVMVRYRKLLAGRPVSPFRPPTGPCPRPGRTPRRRRNPPRRSP